MQSKMTIHWKRNTAKYSNGEIGIVGKWRCFEIVWDGLLSRDDKTTPPYQLACALPGIKPHLGNFQIDAAKAKAQHVLDHWLKGLSGESTE